MAKTVCLAIGVADAPPYDYLRGAVNGAKAIANWAQEMGYPSKLLVDEEDPVELEHVTEALNELLSGTPEALILYFAGHGVSRAVGEDCWLLSRWQRKQKAISINALRDRLCFFGLKRLIIISDACRNPVDYDTQIIQGESLLDRGPFEEQLPQCDLWYSTSRGRAAFMIPGDDPKSTRCIFSGILIEALAGAHPSAFEPTEPGRPITNFSLANFLEKEVPERAGRYGVSIRPANSTGIRPPMNRYRVGPPTVPPTFPPWPPPDVASIAAMGSTTQSRRIVPAPGDSWSTRSAEPREAAAPSGQPSSGRILGPVRNAGIAISAVSYALTLVDYAPYLPEATALRPATDIAEAIESLLEGVAGFGALVAIIAVGWMFLLTRNFAARLESSRRRLKAMSQESSQVLPDVSLDAIVREDAVRNARADKASSMRAQEVVKVLRRETEVPRPKAGAALMIQNARAVRAVGGSFVASTLLNGGQFVHLEQSSGIEKSVIRSDYSERFWAPVPVLVELSTGDWAATVALPGFVLTLGVAATGVETALFRAIHEPTSAEAESVMAQLAASGLSGDQTPATIEALRAGKHADPMMGVIAAWLHYAAGDIDNIRRTAYFFAEREQPVPFDIALLGRFKAFRSDDGLVRVEIPPVAKSNVPESVPNFLRRATLPKSALIAGRVPLLRQGWQLLDPKGRGDLYPPGLAEVAPHLRSAPFTTLDSKGGKKLAAILFDNEGGL